jgi:ABC-type nitrate/sulfonate/bicarbonate transport system substrate-binding protein
MPQWLTTVLSSLLPSLIVGICTAIFSVRLALRRFHAERWWERKAEAYSQIVEALYHAMEYCAAHSDEDTTGQQISEEREKELSEGYVRAYRELRKATSVGAYIISDEVAEVLAKLEKRPRLDPKDCAWFEIYDADYQAYKTTLAEVRALAKKDLRI